MLLKRCCPGNEGGIHADDANTITSSSSSNKNMAIRFLEAVSNTKSLARPEYINIDCCEPTAVIHSARA